MQSHFYQQLLKATTNAKSLKKSEFKLSNITDDVINFGVWYLSYLCHLEYYPKLLTVGVIRLKHPKSSFGGNVLPTTFNIRFNDIDDKENEKP